jgi:cytosine/adenosine deaminase-related metal-dependent hydrolase
VSGNIQSHSYTPSDLYWGQISGCLEALDAGTTTVLDHSHSSYTQSHAEAVFSATLASGLRCVLSFSPIAKIGEWNESKCESANELTVEMVMGYIESLLSGGQGKDGFEGRVYLGFGFDFFFLPKEYVLSIFKRMRSAGVKLITTHVAKNLVFGTGSTTNLLDEYGLLDRDIVVSHATGIDEGEKRVLKEKGVFVSSTPETECQMALGEPLALHEGVNGCLGVDCHSNNSSSILSQARTLMQVARVMDYEEKKKKGVYPKKVVGSVEKAFNLATMSGARALGLEDKIGSIKVGKKADLVVWDWEESVSMLGCGDPLVAVVRHSDARDVECVIVNGRVVKESGKLSPVVVDGEVAGLGESQKQMSWRDIARETMKSRKDILERIDKKSWEKAKEMLVGMFYIDESKIV